MVVDRPVRAGRQTGGVLCLLRSRIVRHEVVRGSTLALFRVKDFAPDLYFTRGTILTADRLTELRREYVVIRNGGFTDYEDEHGGAYFAVAVASARPEPTK